MIKYLRQQITLIENSLSLRLFGAALALTHIWTFFYWNRNNFFVNSQSATNIEPICFPFFPNCDLFRQSISTNTWQIILYLYLFLGILSFFLFFNKKLTKWAYSSLALLTLLKLGLHLSNYNFMGNYHYMVHVISFVYLLLPHKKIISKYLIVGFYIAAGFLKINIDWLSGAAMIRSPYISNTLLVPSLYYVIFLELIFVFALLHKNKWLRWAALSQFIIFHIFSWHIVGFFYPMVMFSLLSVFLIDEYFYYKGSDSPKDHLLAFFNFKETKIVYLVLGFFTVLQILPFILTSDPSLSGAARLSSLNMFDSKTECHTILVAHTQQGTMHIRKPMKNLGTRLKCDPLIFLNQALQLCRKNKEFKEIDRLSLSLLSKRVTQTHFKKVLDIKDVCRLSNPLWAEFSEQRSL